MAVPLSKFQSYQSVFLRFTHHVLKRCVNEPLSGSRTASFSLSHHLLDKQTADSDTSIVENPFFEKYKQKIHHMQNTSPEAYNERMKDLAEKRSRKVRVLDDEQGDKKIPLEVTLPSEVAQAGVGMTKPKGLDSVMKMELIQDKSTEEIIQIWNQYHSGKDILYAVLKKNEYDNLFEKSKECPVFVFPIPRADGFEFILAQFDRHDVYFTPLAMFQLVRENAPPCLTVNHFTELIDDKGIVLMSGQYDDKVLSQTLALSLVQQLSIFYGKDSKYYDIVRRFNYEPESFKYEELIDALKTLPQYDLR